MSDINFEGQHPRKGDGKFRQKPPLPKGDLVRPEPQERYEWKGWGYRAEQMEWDEDCRLSETNFPSSALEAAEEEFKKNPKAEIWYCTAGEVDSCVKAVYFVDLGKINLSDDVCNEWTDASFYEGSTPAEILDDATFDWLETLRLEAEEERQYLLAQEGDDED